MKYWYIPDDDYDGLIDFTIRERDVESGAWLVGPVAKRPHKNATRIKLPKLKGDAGDRIRQKVRILKGDQSPEAIAIDDEFKSKARLTGTVLRRRGLRMGINPLLRAGFESDQTITVEGQTLTGKDVQDGWNTEIAEHGGVVAKDAFVQAFLADIVGLDQSQIDELTEV